MDENPTISAVMIVRDEEKLLPRCLESIKEHVDEIVVVDTGSNDRTVEIAKSYGARMYRHSWEDDFSKHRNQSIDYASGDWVFVIDADEELSPGDGPKLKEAVRSCRDVDAILITVESGRQGGGKSVHNSIRLFKNQPQIRYEGRVHNEVTGVRTGRHVPIRLVHYGYDVDDNQNKRKFDRTVRLLYMDVQDNPNHPRPHHYLGVSFLTMNMYEGAAREAEAAIQLCESCQRTSDLYSGSYYVASTAHMKLGNLRKAEYWALECLKRYPKHLDSLFNLASVYFEKDDLPLFWTYIDKYFEVFDQIKKKGGGLGMMIFYTMGFKWVGHLYKGCALIKGGSRRKGENEFDRALACCPDRAHCYRLLAGFYSQKNDVIKAEDEFNKAVDESPEGTEVMLDFARFYKKQKDLESERKWLEKLIQLDPLHNDGLFELAVSNLEKNEFEKAAQLFARVIELDGKHVESRVNLALCLRKLGRFEESVRHCLEVLYDNPSSLEALSNLAYAYYGLQKWGQAGEYFSRLTELHPDQLDAHVHLAQLFLLNQDVESCVSSCDRILKLLDLKREFALYSLADLGDQFLAIAQKMLSIKKPYLSRICSEMGKILTSSQSCPM